MSATGKEIAWYLAHDGVKLTKTKRAGVTTQQLVLINLALYANESGIAWTGRETLAKVTQLSEQSVSDALAALEAQGLIARTRAEKKKGARVYWRVLPGIDLDTIATPVDNPPQVVGLARHSQQQDDGQDVGRVVGQVVGRVVGLARHEQELEREHKPPREKTAKQAEAGNCGKLYGWANKQEKELALEQIVRPAVAAHFEHRPTKDAPGDVLVKQKETAGMTALEEMLVTFAARYEWRPDKVRETDTHHATQLVAIQLAGEPLRTGDIAKLGLFPDLSA